MNVKFDEATHTYAIDGEIVPISVTELLRKHGLAPDYSGASTGVLERAATRGTAVHADIARFIDGEAYETIEARNFRFWAEENTLNARAEQVVGYSKDGFMLAGTIDVFGTLDSGDLFLGDHKTTAKFDEDYVAWQTSIYDYMLRQLNGQELNGEKVNWVGAKRLYCFWYAKDGEMQAIELGKIPDSEIERLFDCERKGEIYTPTFLANPTGQDLLVRAEQAEREIEMIEAQRKEAEEYLKAVQEKLIEAFEKYGVKKFENEHIRMTYTAPHTTRKIDTKALKAEQPEIAERYSKESEVKASVRITLKGEKNENN